MYKRKLKILFNSEASFSQTGYGRIYYELISRIHATGKYRIAELGSFAEIGSPQDHIIKWRFYANQVNDKDPRYSQFCSNEANKTNAWRFDKVLLDFKPDIVCTLKDSTMDSWINLSPLRKFFYFIAAPSVDSAPQIDDWVSYMMGADCVIGYADYGMKVMEEEGGGKIKLFKAAYPSVNFKTFFPIQNKNNLRQKYGIDPNANIIGFCARNQTRKLIPNLMKAFSDFLEQVKKTDINSYNSYYLYLNTTHPDLCQWDLNKLLVEYKLTNKVLFTYLCTRCHQFFPNKFQDILTTCKYCNQPGAILPRVNYMIGQEQLNEVYNLFDVYVQYVNCEAIGMPIVEAAGAGIPVMGIDYSGVGDAVRRLNGIPLQYHCLTRDIRVNADRAVPNNQHLVHELLTFFKRPRQINLRNGIKTHELCKQNFNWEKYTDIWMEAIDNYQPVGLQGKWHANFSYQPQQINENQSIASYTSDMLTLGLQEHYFKNNILFDSLVKNAENGMVSTGNGVTIVDKNQIKNTIVNIINNKIQLEHIRTAKAGLPNEDFMDYAELKELSNL
jgi:glycosyltransferase involved in cell wall biosynthesis